MGLSTSKKAIGAHSISGIPHTSMGTLVLRIWALEIIWYLVWMLRAKVLCVDPAGDAGSYWEARGFDPSSWEKFVPARTAEVTTAADAADVGNKDSLFWILSNIPVAPSLVVQPAPFLPAGGIHIQLDSFRCELSEKLKKMRIPSHSLRK